MQDQTVELEICFVTSCEIRSYRLEVGVIMVEVKSVHIMEKDIPFATVNGRRRGAAS